MIRLCANLHFMYRDAPFLERFAAAAKDGFAGVEMTFLYDYAATEIRAAADRPGVPIVEFNAPAGRIEPGVRRGLAAVPGHEREYLDQIHEGLAYARAFDCKLLLSLAGVVLPDASRAAAMQTFIMNLRKAADLCAPIGVTLLIETNNLHDNPNYLLRTLAEAREVIDRVERPNLRVIFDFYHVQIKEGDVTRRFLEYLDLIDHIQFANPPGRNEPGVGELDFDHIFHLIESSGYEAWVGAEYFPSRDTQESLRWLRDRGYLR
jgi:hydroxypyruvate isomerase